MASTFLSIPAEIRQVIYGNHFVDCVCVHDHVLQKIFWTTYAEVFLLLVCRKVNTEAMEILLRYAVHHLHGATFYENSLSSLPRIMRYNIRFLKLDPYLAADLYSWVEKDTLPSLQIVQFDHHMFPYPDDAKIPSADPIDVEPKVVDVIRRAKESGLDRMAIGTAARTSAIKPNLKIYGRIRFIVARSSVCCANGVRSLS